MGKKITILGAGNVGATIAYTLAVDGMASEIVLVDINRNKAKGEALDIPRQGRILLWLRWDRPANRDNPGLIWPRATSTSSKA